MTQYVFFLLKDAQFLKHGLIAFSKYPQIRVLKIQSKANIISINAYLL